MKFAKVLQQTLVEEDLPQEWVEAAIQYKVLKKYIGKVVKELEFLGLSKSDLKILLQEESSTVEVSADDALPTNPIVAHYTLKKSDKQVVPYLKIVISNSDNQKDTQDRVNALADEIRAKLHAVMTTDEEEPQIIELREDKDSFVLSPTTSRIPEDEENVVKVENSNEIIIKLNSDTKFFKMLNSELALLDAIRKTEEQRLIDKIETLSDGVLSQTQKNNGLYLWRELFRIYLDSEVYFRYNETSSTLSERTADQVKKNLDDFSLRVQKAQLLDKFKSKKAVKVYDSFMDMNSQLLKIIHFQAINTTALRKILKKFDKQTSLNVSDKFPQLISQDHIFINGSSVAQSICFVLQNKLLTLVPQLDDYTCPICMSVAFKPIRLDCGHIFCVRCLVKSKQRKKNDCPICRYRNAILLADSGNLDHEAMALIKKFFPLEVKEKLREVNKERYEETVGPKDCTIV